jgi:hypothetical protein
LQLRRNPCTVKRFGVDKAVVKREIEDDARRLIAIVQPVEQRQKKQGFQHEPSALFSVPDDDSLASPLRPEG